MEAVRSGRTQAGRRQARQTYPSRRLRVLLARAQEREEEEEELQAEYAPRPRQLQGFNWRKSAPTTLPILLHASPKRCCERPG